MPISIKELAKLAGVSITTVTRALQDKPDIKKETKSRVLELAQIHQYRPNILARSLVTNKTYTIGVIVPDLANPFFPSLIKGAESTLWQAGYSVILADTDFDPEKEKQTVSEFISRRVDGLIMSPIETQNYREWLDQIRGAGVPFVSLTRLENHDADTVVASDKYGSREAVTHLLEMGRNKILYLGNISSHWANSQRIEGYREALVQAGIPFEPELVRQVSSGTIDAAAAELRTAFTAGIEFSAVIAFDDMMALGARKAIFDSGKTIPDDIALVGFDNIELTSLPEIDLTTVDIPKFELGRVSARLVLERITDQLDAKDEGVRGELLYKEIVLNTRLVVRGTTSPGKK